MRGNYCTMSSDNSLDLFRWVTPFTLQMSFDPLLKNITEWMYCTLSTWSYKYCLNEVIIHTPPRTILGFVEMSHFCGIFHFPQRHWNDAILKKNNSSSLSKGQMTHFQNINSLIALASGQTSWADNISNGFGMKLYICLDKRERNLTGVSGRCHF